jgi:UDPglucose 6-dehydrogenase
MKLVFIGTGYVGLVTGACLAELGHRVTCVDIDSERIEKLNRGEEIFYEPGLPSLVARNKKAGRLKFTDDLKTCLRGVQAVFIAVGTPQAADGSADLSYVRAAARDIGRNLKSYAVIVNKSTVPVGTAEIVRREIKKYYRGAFDVASNPEFLREGSAVSDFLHPDRVVVGTDSGKAQKVMAKIYSPLQANKMFTAIPTAELIKYASNSFLATKLSFINEIANLAERVGANVDEVAAGMGLDSRIGPKFLKAGFGFGGSCFPKDVSALNHIARSRGYNFRLVKTVLDVNANQKKLFFEKIKKFYHGRLRGKKIAVLGLAFKGNTDDVRESPALDLIGRLSRAGAKIVAYDPQAIPNALKECPRLRTETSYLRAARDADGLVIATEWEQFKKMSLAKLKKTMRRTVIFDGRNLLDPDKVRRAGFRYIGVGKD